MSHILAQQCCCSPTRALSLPLLVCCSLFATGGSTNTRRHRLPVPSLRERRVAVVPVVCVARADSSFTQYVSDVASSRSSAAVVLLALFRFLCLRAALCSRLADQLTRAVIACLCSPCTNDVWLWLLWLLWHAMILLRSRREQVMSHTRAVLL